MEAIVLLTLQVPAHSCWRESYKGSQGVGTITYYYPLTQLRQHTRGGSDSLQIAALL